MSSSSVFLGDALYIVHHTHEDELNITVEYEEEVTINPEYYDS